MAEKQTIQDILAGSLEAPNPAKAAAAQRGTVEIIIMDPCKIGGKHVDMGEVVTIDLNVAGDRANLGQLHQAGRVALKTDENVADVKARRAQRDKTFTDARKTADTAPAAAPAEINLDALIQKMKDAGFTVTPPAPAKPPGNGDKK